MQFKIPIGSSIDRAESSDIIKIRVPNTKFWVLGEKISKYNWKMSLIDPQSNYKELIKENISTKAFAILSSMILKSPFPYKGKRANSSKTIKNFVNKNIKNIC